MFFQNVSLIATAIAAVASMVVGFLWYSPLILGRPWMKAMGYTPESLEAEKAKGMGRTYALSFLSTIVLSFATGVVVNSIVLVSIWAALAAGLVLSIGFVVSVRANDLLFAKDRSVPAFLINNGYQILSIVLMTVVHFIFS